MSRPLAALAAAVFTLVLGHVVDRTTGQPLPGLAVQLVGAHLRRSTRTNAAGTFRLRVPAGRYTLRVQSRDVPPQHFAIALHGGRTVLTERACSTTLDYSCDATLPQMNAGG